MRIHFKLDFTTSHTHLSSLLWWVGVTALISWVLSLSLSLVRIISKTNIGLPILISNLLMESAHPCEGWQFLLKITTVATGRDSPRSTLHQGSSAWSVCIQEPLYQSVLLFPSTARDAAPPWPTDTWVACLLRAKSENKNVQNIRQ